MGFLKKLAQFFTPAPALDTHSFWFTVQCLRCGEQIRGRVDLRNDLSIDYGDSEGATGYHCRKVLMGENRCFQQIEVSMTFDTARRLVDQQIQGGKFVTPAADKA